MRSAAAARLCALLLAAPIAWVAPASVHAQALDEIRVDSVGQDAILRIRFNVRVQYQRHAPLDASDLIEIYFQLLGNDESLTRPIEESMTIPAKDPAPGATVVYPVQTNLPVKKIIVRLGRKVDFRVRAGINNQLLEIVLPGLAPKDQQQAAAAPVEAPIVEKGRYAISLQTVPVNEQSNVRAIPARLQDYSVFGAQVQHDGVRDFELILGYFDSDAEAQKVLASVLGDFPGAHVFDVAQRKEQTLELAARAAAAAPAPAVPETPMPGAAATAAAEVAAAPESDLDRQGADLMAKSRTALIGGKNDEAINTLNQLLLLPPNKYSRDAQELIGLARERSGDLVQARKEYELYLRLFPTGDGATRVRQRLATLAPPEVAPAPAAKIEEKRPPQFTAGGSISQYYYGGKQQVQTAFANVPQLVSQQSITNTTQSSLVTIADLNARYKTDTSDTRVVVRDSDQYSFINTTEPSLNRLDAAYVDYRNIPNGLSVKAGRQSGVTGGLVGRYDGAAVGYDVRPKLRLNVVVGKPVSQDQFVDSKQFFEGVSMDAQNVGEHWGGSAFVINQTAAGVVDRRAVGGELRYFDQQKTLYSLVDYDVEFATLNAVTLQGTYQFEDQTSLSLLLDNRKAPTLETSNGLLQTGCNSYSAYFDANNSCHAINNVAPALTAGQLSQYLAGQTVTPPLTAGQLAALSIITPTAFPPYTTDQLHRNALATTANTHQFALDVSRPFGKHWQLSADLRVTAVGALPTVTLNTGQTFQGTSATGNVFGLTLQATGSNLYSKRDIDVFSLTHLHSASLNGDQFSVSNLNGLLDNRLTLEPNLSYYHETDSNGQRLTRISPGFRASYKVLTRLSLEATVALERSRNEGPVQTDTTSNVFYYLGYRYDLNY